MLPDYYKILGVNRSASEQEIKKAFKKLAVKYHPDKNAGNKNSEEEFKRINSAYQVLSDSTQKYRYDSKLEYQEFQARQRAAYSQSNTQKTSKSSRSTNKSSESNSSGFKEDWSGAYSSYTPPNTPPPKRRVNTKVHRGNKDEFALQRKFAFYGIIYLAIVMILSLVINWKFIDQDKLTMDEETYELLQKAKNKKKIDYDDLDQLKSIYSDSSVHSSERSILADAALKLMRAEYKMELRNGDVDGALSIAKSMLSFPRANAHNDTIEYKIAFCYMHLGAFDSSLFYLNLLFEKGKLYNDAFIYDKLGDVYLLKKENKKAIEFYTKAVDKCEEKYVADYGTQFMFVLSPEELPDLHYDIYRKAAHIKYENGELESSLSLISWAIFLRPENKAAKDLLRLFCIDSVKTKNSNKVKSQVCSAIKELNQWSNADLSEELNYCCP